MKTKLILFFFVFIEIVASAQIKEAPWRFLLPGEVQESKYLQSENIPIPTMDILKFVSKSKSNSDCIDTLYKVRFTTIFTDVNDWDSAYFISGYTHNESHLSWDSANPAVLTVLKVDYTGQVLWTRTDSVIHADHFTFNNTSIIRLSDGNFLQTGFANNRFVDPKHYDWRVAIYTKFDTYGNTIWQKTYSDTAYLKSGDWPQDIIAEEDGGFTVAALVASDSKHFNQYDTSDHFLYVDTTYIGLIRYDSLGNIKNRQKHFIGGHPVVPSIGLLMKQSDGGYLVGGVNLFNGVNFPRNYFLLKTDSAFNWQWKKLIGQTSDNRARMKILPTLQNRYFFALNRADTPIVYDAYGGKYYNSYYQIGYLDSNINILHDTIFQMYLTNPPSVYYYDAGVLAGAVLKHDGNGIITCSMNGSGGNLMHLDSNLQFRWNRWIAYFPYFKEEPNKMRQAHDGGYLVVGKSSRPGVGGWFVKTDTNGFALPNGADTLYHIGIGEQPDQNISFRVYPNPATKDLNISFEEIPQENIEIQLFDITGRQLKSMSFSSQISVVIDVNDLTTGVYLLHIKIAKGSNKTIKIIKQ